MSVFCPEPAWAEPPFLTIRPARGFDAPAVAWLRSLCTTGAPASEAFTRSMRIWLDAEGESRITLIASAEEQAVGLISMLEHRGMPEPGSIYSRWGYVDHVFVKAEEQGRGVGTALIGEALAIAERRNYEKVAVSPSSSALALFHGLGFLMQDELGPAGTVLVRPRAESA